MRKWRRMHLLNRRDFGALPPNAVPISRGTPFGNPFHIGVDGSRKDVIERYREWFHGRIKRDKQFRRDVLQLLGHDLVCWCAPKPCHGQVIIDWLRSREEALVHRQTLREHGGHDE